MHSKEAPAKRGRGRPGDPEKKAKREEKAIERNKLKRGRGRPPSDPEKVEAKRVQREKIAANMAKMRGLRTWKNAREKNAAKTNPGTVKGRGRPAKNPPREEENDEEEEEEEELSE